MPNKKESVEQLWRNCFEDTDAFIRLFFDKVYRDENTFTLKIDGQTVCALQIIPYQMQCEGELLTVGYVCGVCTEVEFRKNGLASQLIEEVIDKMYGKYDTLALIPANADLTNFYRRFDFIDAFGYDTHRVVVAELPYIPEENDILIATAETFDKDILFSYFDNALRRRCSILHGREDFSVICEEIRLDGGEVLCATTVDGKLCGIIFTLPCSISNSVLVKEILSDNNAANNVLLRASTSFFSVPTATYRTIDNRTIDNRTIDNRAIDNRQVGTTNFYGMIRILNPNIAIKVKNAFISLMLE